MSAGRPATKDLRLRPAAREDIQAVVAHYRADSGPGIALAFTDQLQRAMVQMGRGLDRGSARLAPALDVPGLRVWQVPRFPHLLIAFERPDHFDLLRVLHGKRDFPADFAA